MYILGIESSCDETGAAVVKNGTTCIAESLASSKSLHEATGGIVPEVAARKQVDFIIPVLDQIRNSFDFDRIDAIAVTVGPGLIGSLIVGIEAAKALALALRKPLVPVNHLIGHVYANFIDSKDEQSKIEFPSVVLVVSGGHTDLILMRGHFDFEFLGGTYDDAAGEAFDKTARLLGLSKYLGGSELSKVAATCVVNKAKNLLPRPMFDQPNFDFSFSGLKTAVKALHEKKLYDTASIAREFEDAVVEVLVDKTIKAAVKTHAKSVLLGGGVSANSYLRQEMQKAAAQYGLQFHSPPINLCSDNAIYIASAGYFYLASSKFEKATKFDPDYIAQIEPKPSLTITEKAESQE